MGNEILTPPQRPHITSAIFHPPARVGFIEKITLVRSPKTALFCQEVAKQIPEKLPFPIPLLVFFLELPLELHEASYFAESAKIFNFSNISIIPPPNICTNYIIKK